MSVLSSDDLRRWRSSVAAVLRRCGPDGPWDALFALGVLDTADRRTGQGGLTELAVAVAECGGGAGSAPLLAQAFGVRALLAAVASPVRDQLLDAGIAGQLRVYLALGGGIVSSDRASIAPGGDWAGVTPTATARAAGDGWCLDADDGFIVAAGAGVLLVPAMAAAGPSLFAVDATADGVGRRDLPSLDPTRPLAHVRLRNAPAAHLPLRAVGGDRVLMAELATLVAADSIGGARAVLSDVVAYARQRTQFGRLIGSFQAVKHRLADLSVALDHAEAALEWAQRCWAEDDPDTELYSSIAKVAAVDAYRLVTEGAIQTYGGIGFTWEHPVHIFLKRAQTNGQLAGGSRQHLEFVADRAGL